MNSMTQMQNTVDMEQLAEMAEMLSEMAEVIPALIGGMLIFFILWRVILGLVCRKVTSNRDRKGGFWWGFFMGFIGIIVAAVRPKE